MEKFLGTFKKIPESATGSAEGAKILELPKVIAEMVHENESTLIIAKDRDTYTMTGDSEANGDKFVFKLDEPFTSITDDGLATPALVKIEGGHLVGERKYDNFVRTIRCYIEGDKLVVVISGKGVTMKSTYQRM